MQSYVIALYIRLSIEDYKYDKLLKTKNAYAALTAQAKREQEEADRQVQRKSITKELADATGLTTALADLLIDRVRLYPGGRIEIEYKVQDLFQ